MSRIFKTTSWKASLVLGGMVLASSALAQQVTSKQVANEWSIVKYDMGLLAAAKKQNSTEAYDQAKQRLNDDLAKYEADKKQLKAQQIAAGQSKEVKAMTASKDTEKKDTKKPTASTTERTASTASPPPKITMPAAQPITPPRKP